MSLDRLGKPIVIAAFDFDGTLTRRDTLLPFLACGLGWPRFIWLLLRCSPWLLGFALRLMPNHVAKQKLLCLAFRGKSIVEMDEWTERWLSQDFSSSCWRDWTLKRLKAHQAAGHCCVLVSASPDVYLKRVADYLSFDALLCTEMSVFSGILTGQMRTPNCYGLEKVKRLQEWCFTTYQLDIQNNLSFAYGNCSSDEDMLSIAVVGTKISRSKYFYL